MKITSYYKRLKLSYLSSTLVVLFFSIFFTRGYVTFQETGDNIFHISVNNIEVGTLESKEAAEELLVIARKNIAKSYEDMVLMNVEMTLDGEEVLWGYVDDKAQVLQHMEAVLKESVIETKKRSYTVKVNDYMVNLSSAEEVKALLEAAVGKYDIEDEYDIEIRQDEERVFNVLSSQIVSKEVMEEQQNKTELSRDVEAGIQNLFDSTEYMADTEVEKDFSEYELGLLSMEFVDKIEIVEAYLPAEHIMSIEEAIVEVTEMEQVNTVYKVTTGDTLSEIAIKVDIPVDKLVEMNDALENENSVLQIDQELVIMIPEAKLTVEWSEEKYVEEIYDEDVIYVDNDDWYTTQTKVLQQPSAGFRKAIAIEVYQNDTMVDRQIVKEEVVMEAVPKIVERGTRIPPTYIKPVSGGRLSSGFGSRSAPTKGASSNHKGVDWSVPTGTAVMASCGGVVAKAGWGSGYGYVVYINHEDGRQTRYGHLSKVLVSVGQSVSQGEKIALSGNTGVSTGPHVHFEILINGKQVNPLDHMN